MKHYDKWISQHDLHEQYEAGYLAEASYREALEWVREYMIKQEPDAIYFDYILLDKIEKELKDEN